MRKRGNIRPNWSAYEPANDLRLARGLSWDQYLEISVRLFSLLPDKSIFVGAVNEKELSSGEVNNNKHKNGLRQVSKAI